MEIQYSAIEGKSWKNASWSKAKFDIPYPSAPLILSKSENFNWSFFLANVGHLNEMFWFFGVHDLAYYYSALQRKHLDSRGNGLQQWKTQSNIHCSTDQWVFSCAQCIQLETVHSAQSIQHWTVQYAVQRQCAELSVQCAVCWMCRVCRVCSVQCLEQRQWQRRLFLPMSLFHTCFLLAAQIGRSFFCSQTLVHSALGRLLCTLLGKLWCIVL